MNLRDRSFLKPKQLAVALTSLVVLSANVMALPTSASAAVTASLTVFAGNGSAGSPTAGPALGSPYRGPNAIAVDASNNVYVADNNSVVVTKITPTGTQTIVAGNGANGSTVAGPATSTHVRPTALAIDASGNLYIADDSNNIVSKVTPSGTLSIIAGTGSNTALVPGPAISSPLASPDALAFDPSGNLYVGVYGQNQVAKITPGGTLSIFAGNGSYGTPVAGPALNSPNGGTIGLAFDASGNMYANDYDFCRITKITPAGVLSIYAGSGDCLNPEVNGPATASPIGYLYGQLAIDAGGDVFFGDSTNHVVSVISPAGQLTVIAGHAGSGAPVAGPGLSSQFSQPEAVALDSSNNLYVADQSNQRVEKLALTGYTVPVVPTVPAPTVVNTPPQGGITIPVHVAANGTVTTVPVFNSPTPATQLTASTSTGNGSWTLAPDGGVFTAGDAGFYGSHGGVAMNAPAVGIAPTASGNGYLIVGSDGGVFAYGNASFAGSMGGKPLNSPVTAIAASCTGLGYYLVAGDGGVFSFGGVGFYGSMAGKPLNQGMVGIVDSCGQNGYWTFAKDGGVFTFGNAKFYGSLGSNTPSGGIVGMVSAPDGKGYWLIGANKHAYGFGSVAN